MLTIYFRSNYWREVHIGIPQPVPFSHQLHSGQLGMDCRYCHTSVQQSTFANIPATETCMTCHSQVAQNSVSLAPVRESWATGNPVEWNKVNKVPDFVYFNHASHVNKGVGCYTCHGRIDQMAVVWKEHPFYMGWCLDCHRQPEKYLRPRDQVFNMEYVPPANQLQLGAQLVVEYNVNKAQLANCAVCHR
ncbi:MAG: cytochrome c family protein [Chloroflexaceae bacterium]|nr:cytochrome c family protein [Chloroflexaceae bacterium]